MFLLATLSGNTQTFETHGTRVEDGIVTYLLHVNCDGRNNFRPPDDVVNFHTEIVYIGHNAAVNIQLARMTIQPKHTYKFKILTQT